MERAEPTAAGLAFERDSNPRGILPKLISSLFRLPLRLLAIGHKITNIRRKDGFMYSCLTLARAKRILVGDFVLQRLHGKTRNKNGDVAW